MSAAVSYAPNRYHRMQMNTASLNYAPTKGWVCASLKGVPLHCIIFRTATEDACASGATLACGGQVPAGKEQGSWITPALITGVTDNMRVSKEEIFGPIIAVQTYSELDDAIARANNTECGLTSYLFGHDTRAISRAFERLEFGEVYVNGIPNGVHLPHCGVKQSGLGCDNSYFSLEEYFDLKRFSMIP